jgi:hypothetical protein
MSTSAPATSSPPPADTTGKSLWRIRTEKGEVFGPSDLATLKVWAQDGRLAPTHQISDDERTWMSVTTLPDLEMDWVAEVMTGSFYGPIHKSAMVELVREGSIRATAPLFQRSTPSGRAPSEHEHQLENRVRELQQETARRGAAADALLAVTRGELEQARAALRARDLEFDAERQEHKGALARIQAELLKRDSRINSLETDAQRLEQLARERGILETRLADAERQTSDHNRLVSQQREEVEQARALQREADRHANLLKDRLSGHERETEALREATRALQLRLGSVRKLLQQASCSLGTQDETTDAVVIESPPRPATSRRAMARPRWPPLPAGPSSPACRWRTSRRKPSGNCGN